MQGRRVLGLPLLAIVLGAANPFAVAQSRPAAPATAAHATPRLGQTPSGYEPIRLSPPDDRPATSERRNSALPRAVLTKVFGSLAIVVGLFGSLVWLSRKSMPKSSRGLPVEAVDILGRTSMGVKQQLQLVRVGRKLVLLCVTPSGATSLTEVTDPEEVDELLGACGAARLDSEGFAPESAGRERVADRRRHEATR